MLMLWCMYITIVIYSDSQIEGMNKPERCIERLLSGTKSVDILPGSTIVVPRDPRPFDWLVMTKTIAPILANLATSAAAIAALDN